MSSRVSVALLVLVHVALHEGPLAAAALFPAYDLLSQLATLLTDIVPVGIKIWMDVAISFDRIQVILCRGTPSYSVSECTKQGNSK